MKAYENNGRVKKNGGFDEWRPIIERKTFKLLISHFWREIFPHPPTTTTTQFPIETETDDETETENEESAGAQQ